MQAVNLLPPDWQGGRKHSLLRSSALLVAGGALAAAAMVAGLLLVFLHANSSLTSRQHELDALQAQLKASVPAALAAPPTSTATPARAAAISELVGARLPWDGFLEAFARVVPEDVWLISLQADSPGAATTVAAEAPAAPATSSGATTTTSTTTSAAPASAASASTFSISGYTYSQPSVARLMRRLALIPWLTNVNLVSSVQATIDNATVIQFTVGADVAPQPQAST